MKKLFLPLLLMLSSCSTDYADNHLIFYENNSSLISVVDAIQYASDLYAVNGVNVYYELVVKCPEYKCIVINDDILKPYENYVAGYSPDNNTAFVSTWWLYQSNKEDRVALGETIAHETGHMLGLKHENDCMNIMSISKECYRNSFNYVQKEFLKYHAQ